MTSALRPEPRPCARDPRLFLRRERAAYQRLQQRFGERRRNAERLRVPPRLQQHLAFAAEVTRRLAGRTLDLGDLLAEGLSLGDELQQFTVDDVEPGAEFFEGFHAVTVLMDGSFYRSDGSRRKRSHRRWGIIAFPRQLDDADDASFRNTAHDPAPGSDARLRGLVSRGTRTEGATQPGLDGARIGHAGRHAVGARRAVQEGRRGPGLCRLLHQLRQPQGP